MKTEIYEKLPGNETADEWFERLCSSDEERSILAQDDGLFRRHLVVRLLGDNRPAGKCLHCLHPFHEGSCNTSTVSHNRPSIPCDCEGHGSPIDMILHCPACGKQHVDAPEPNICKCSHSIDSHSTPADCRGTVSTESSYPCPCDEYVVAWTNPPHKSHLCHGCGIVWRPADVPTNGVATIHTRGKDDTWPDIGDRFCGGCQHELRWHFEYTPLPSGRTGCGHPKCSCNLFITPEASR